ncbi:MAG TPA: hypothetical protein VGD37_10850 [Kofleriaceae bacterium]|jgi:hypothetical protein
MPLLSELPADPGHRDAVLDSANTTARPENRRGMTAKERKAETAAATAAAILGGLFSKTKTVTIGGATQFDENDVIAPDPAPPPRRPSSTDHAGDAASPAAPAAPSVDDPGTSNADLIPWINLRSSPPPAPPADKHPGAGR